MNTTCKDILDGEPFWICDGPSNVLESGRLGGLKKAIGRRVTLNSPGTLGTAFPNGNPANSAKNATFASLLGFGQSNVKRLMSNILLLAVNDHGLA